MTPGEAKTQARDVSLVERYDRLYSDRARAFGEKPDRVVVALAAMRPEGTALELGCGQGRNALFLAARGFDVTAVDISPIGITQLEQRVRADGVMIKALVGDITTFDVPRAVDIVVSTFVLHHVRNATARALIARWKERTNPGGFHAIAAFTDDGDFFHRNPTTADFYPNRTLLRDLYRDWNIRYYHCTRGRAFQQRPNGTHMENVEVRIIAQRPRTR